MSLTERIYGKETAGKPAVSSDTQKNLYTAAANKKPSLANRIAQNGGQPTLYADAAAKQKPSLASRIEANGGTPYADAAAQAKQSGTRSLYAQAAKNISRGENISSGSPLAPMRNLIDDRESTVGSGKYADILKASDYAALSKAGESKAGKLFGDARYDYINDIGDMRIQHDVSEARGQGAEYSKYALMTQDEVGVYNYLYATQGKRAANAFLSDLEPELDKQWYSGLTRGNTEVLGKNAGTRALASTMTVLAQPARTLSSMIAMADDAVRTAKGQEINPYSQFRRMSNLTQDLRADTSQHIEETNPGMGGKVGSFVYNTAMSAADSAMNALVAKGIGEAVGLTGDTLMKATNILGSALMSSEAASLSIAESKEKGYSNAGALALGLTRGAIEYASEAVGGEWVIRKIKANPLSFVKSMALTMIPEGMEEVMSDAANGVVNLAIDAAFGTEESGIPKMLEYYRTSGTEWQKKHAELATVLAVLGQEGLSFLGGALATLGSRGVQYGTNRANINQTAERLDTTPKNVVQMMQDAQTENPGVIYALAELTDAENADDLRQKIGTKEDMKRAAEYLTQQMEAGGRSGAQEGTYTAGAQNAPVGAQRAQNEGNSTTPAAAINIQEGMNNGQSTYQGRENGSYDLRTGGQAAAEGGTQALAGGRAEIPGGVGADAQADLRQVTPAQLGIRNGGTEAVTVVDAQRLGGDAARAYNLLAANNIEPVAVRGAIQVKNGYANAYTESGRVFFRVDAVDSRGNAISPEALVRHELFHNYISEEVLQASDEVIRESMTAEEYDAMYESYRDAYASIYDFENMSEDEIERLLTEEIAADAYAGLNWFSGDAPVQEAVRAETERNAPARRAEAQQETTGPPGKATAAGIGARTADSAALRRAEALEKSGTDNETIRQETGWYRGMDGQWRFEIDDSGMEFRRDGDAQLMKEEGYRRLNELTDRWGKSFENGTELSEAETQEMERLQEEYKDAVWGEKYLLRDFVKHDALFEAYPALNRVSLVFDTLPGGTKGYFSKRDNTIVLSDSLFGKEADVVLHEIQHVIQKTEGFTGGASPEYWNERMENGFSKRWTSGEEMMPSELYRNTAGEIEARDTAARRRMSAEERKNTPPELGDADTVFADGNTMAAYAEANGNIRRNNIEYADNAARNAAQKALHDRMVNEGKILDLTENRENASQYFPNLRSMPKAERTGLLREKIQTLKNDLRTYLNQLKGVNFEFEINGNTIEATVYNAGIKEVLQNLTQDKAGMLSASEEIFRNAEYLYSTQDKTGNSTVTGWDYFYVPVKLGGDAVGVRIAVRNTVKPREAQIYNWGIKREGTSLDGVGHLPKGSNSADVSSDVSSTATIRQTEGNSQEKSSGRASTEVSGINNRTAAELRREYERRMQEYQKATQRDDQSFPYIDEMKWMQAAERRLAELGDGKRKRRTVGNTKRDIMRLFFTDTANRTDVEQMLNRNIGEMMAQGEIREDALDTIVDEMLQAGSVVSNSENSPWIDETHEEIRSDLRGTKLYVSEQTWRDFRKDEARTLREQAREAGITLSKNQNDTAADVRNMELAEKYGEALFPTDISAPDMLRNIVDRAAKGVSEKQTLADRLWDEARLEGAGRDQQEAYDRMVGALRDQTEVILREFAEDNHLTLREQTKQGSGSETGTKSEAEQRRERLQTLAEQDRREMERLRARENLGAGQRFVPNKSSGEVYRDLMGKGKSEVKVQMTGFLKGTPKESTFKVEVKPTPIGGYYEATIFHDGHKADTLVRALKETAARDAAEEVITMANRNFSEENYQRAKKFEAEKTADEDARIAELFGDPEQLDSTETSPKSSDAAETENTAAGATIDATTEKVTSEVIKAERNYREDFEKITSGAMRMFVNAGDTVRRIAKATGSKSLEGYYFNAGAYSQRAGNWIAKGGARTDIDGHRIGASLADTLAPMRKNETKYRDFQLYLLHMHNVDRMKYDNSGELERIKENLRWVKEKYPELRELSNEELRRIANSDSDSPVVRQAAHEIYLAAHNGEAPSLTSVAEGAAYALELERQRAIVEKQGLKPVFGYDVTADDSQTAAQLLEAKNPEFKEWAKEVYRYSDDLIRYRVEAGLITPEFANALKKRYPHYIPTFREEGTNSKRARRARRNGGIVVSNAIGRAVGSDGVLLPLHTALSRKTVSTMRNAGLNQFGLALVREYDRNTKAAEKYIWNVAESEYTPTEAAIESDEDYKPVFENVFSVKEKGKVYDITMDEGLAQALNAFQPDKYANSDIAKLLKKGNDLFKALCTGYNPIFMVRNLVRDAQDAAFYSTDSATWAKMFPSAWKQIVTNGEIWQQYKALGGSYASMLDYTTGMVKEPKSAVGKLAAKYESLGQAIEAAPRLAEFMTILANKGGSKTADGVKTGKFTQSDLMEAMLGAADITTNFARGGTVTKMLNKYLVPFLNPSVQGADKFVRNITDRKGFKAWASLAIKAAALGILPELLNGLLYRDDDEWDDIPDQTKSNYYLFKLGDGYWMKIPRGRALAVFSAGATYAQEKAKGNDPKFSDVIEVVKSNVAPTDIFNQNIATAWTQTKLFNPDNPGTTWYGGNIESDRLQNYRPGERYDEKTDELSKWIGKTFNLSPKKINYLLDQYSGVVGDLLLPWFTPSATASSPALAPLKQAFMLDSTSTNKTTGEYYDLLDDLKYDANDGDIGAGITRKYVSHAGDEVNDYYQQIRAIQSDENLTKAEKNRLVRALKSQLIERQKEIIAQAEPYREAVSDYLKAHPELSTDNDAAIAEYAERYEITEDQAESRMDAIVYREANREVFGAEYALRTYNADVYDKARTAYAKGVSYDTYYDYYFATKEMHADKDKNGKSISGSKKAKVVEYINSLDIPPEQKDALYVAAGYTAKSARNQKWNGGSGGSGGRRGRGKRTELKAPTPKAPEIIIPKYGTASSAKAGGTSKTPKVSGNVIADFTKTASGTDIQKAVTQAKRKALKAGNRTVYVEEGSPIDYFLKYGKLPSLK